MGTRFQEKKNEKKKKKKKQQKKQNEQRKRIGNRNNTIFCSEFETCYTNVLYSTHMSTP